jgi:LysM repeat protein
MIVHLPSKFFKMKIITYLIAMMYFFTIANAQNKSINVDIVNGNFVCTHNVKAKETFFSIAQLYNVSIDEIEKQNKLKSDELKINTALKIPFSTANITYSKGDKLIYTIKKGDTYSSIILKQKLNLKEVKRINNVKDDNLKLGQKLIIGFWNDDEKNIEKNQLKETTTNENQKVEFKKTEEKKSNDVLKTNENKGWAMCLPTDTKVDKNYALHNTAKIGSIIKVKNIKNEKVISAKVLGRIPANVTDILVLLSGNASSELGVKNEKFEVMVTN